MKEAKQPAPTYTKMKAGEYQVHVLLEATSGLSLDENSDSAIDVIVSIEAFQKTQYTKVKDDVGFEETFWGQHFFFNQSFDSNIKIENQRLVFSVWDRNKVLRNSLVGNYQIDIKYIYAQPDHCIKNQWYALSNIQRSFNQITGYVKVSIAVMGEGDKNIELELVPISSITSEKKIILPPNIERKTYQLIVDVYSGKNIKPADGDSVDSYIGVEFGQIYERTEPIMTNVNPEYNKRVFVPMGLPTVSENIAIRINDFNYIQKNEIIGSHYISIATLLEQSKKLNLRDEDIKKIKYGQLRWINFYGPQMKSNKQDQKNIHQFFPSLATYYVGSVLMRVRLEENSAPVRLSEPITKKPEITPVVYHKISALITGALNIKERNQKYSISIRVGADEIKTDFVQCKNGFCLWAVQKTLTVATYRNQEVPDIFVYLVNANQEKICFVRYPATMGQILDDKWVSLTPDLSLVSLQKEEAGYLKLGLFMQSVEKKQASTSRAIESGMNKIFSANKGSGKLVVQLIAAESLIPLDDDGGLDPFFVFSYMHMEGRSTLKNDTLNPIYFQKIIIDAQILDEESCPPIVVNVYDQDKFSKQFLGTTFIDIGQAKRQHKSLSFDLNQVITPKWYDLKQNDVRVGRFLASFRLLKSAGSIPPSINIPRRKFTVNLMMLGLRGLKSTGILSVKKPYIQFDYESLNLFGEEKANAKAKNIVTQPKDEGSSVNIHSINKTVLILPQNPGYWPSLSAKVKDCVLGGVYQPTLGYFSINLREAYETSKIVKKRLLEEESLMTFKAPSTLLNLFAPKKERNSQKLKNIHPKLLQTLKNFIIKAINYNWTILTKQTELNSLKDNPKAKINPNTIVVFPNYVKSENQRYVEQNREFIKSKTQYMAIGYDSKDIRSLPTLEKRSKHYRFMINQPYDQYYERVNTSDNGVPIKLSNESQIRKGRSFTNDSALSTLLRKVTDEDSYAGIYKGNCFIDLFREQLGPQDKRFTEYCQQTMKRFLKTTKIMMFLYVIEAANLPSKDLTSLSDPYLIIRVGEKVFDARAFENESNPQFNQKIKAELEFPRDSILQIQVWDQDPLKVDELIGTAVVDIENRVFANLGNSIRNNPIQTHPLKAKQSKLSQGLIRFWIDLIPADQLSFYRELNIEQKIADEIELRVVVWGCNNIPINDFEGMNDLFITCIFQDEIQQTDTHYRSAGGIGNFNWRMVYKTKVPVKNPTLTFRVYDKDIIGSDDYLCSGTFSIGSYLEEVWESDFGTKLYLGEEDLSKYSDCPSSSFKIINGKKCYDRFEVDLFNKEKNKNNFQKLGKIELSIQIVTKEEAIKKPVGKGRSDPNHHPTLPQPKDRFVWSWNPITLFTRLLGRSFRYKIGIVLLCLILILLFYNLGHSYVGSILGNLTTPTKR